jgi:hypothetical protein
MVEGPEEAATFRGEGFGRLSSSEKSNGMDHIFIGHHRHQLVNWHFLTMLLSI